MPARGSRLSCVLSQPSWVYLSRFGAHLVPLVRRSMPYPAVCFYGPPMTLKNRLLKSCHLDNYQSCFRPTPKSTKSFNLKLVEVKVMQDKGTYRVYCPDPHHGPIVCKVGHYFQAGDGAPNKQTVPLHLFFCACSAISVSDLQKVPPATILQSLVVPI